MAMFQPVPAFIFTYRGVFVPLSLLPAAIIGVTGDEWLRFAVGLPLLIAGMGIRLLGIRELGGRARVHVAGARQVITRGIFGHLRNPLYLGNTLALGGASALYFSLWGAPLVMGFLLCIYTLIVLYEEKCLLLQFGETYGKYKARVPRWWIRLRSYPDSAGSDPPTPWREVFKRERNFISCYLILTLVACSGITKTSWFGHIPSTLIILLVVLALFLRVAAGLKKKKRHLALL